MERAKRERVEAERDATKEELAKEKKGRDDVAREKLELIDAWTKVLSPQTPGHEL